MPECGKIRRLFRILAILLAAAHTFTARHAFGSDCRSYVEVARAYLRHDWTMAINAYWSPLYSWFLAIVLAVVRPTLRSEFPVIHVANMLVFLACMASFEFFMSRALRMAKARVSGKTSVSLLPLPVLWVLGYSMFIWVTVGVLVPLVTPDLLVTAIAFCVSGVLIDFDANPTETRTCFLFGLLLGIGYLAKAVMFPMAFVFLVVCFLTRPSRQHGVRVVLALLIFLAVAAPEVICLSRAKGRLTFSDTGRLAFAWTTFDLPIRNWQGLPLGFGVPSHPTRKIYDHPAVFEFNGPLRASYPPWFDPSYWNEGLKGHFEIRAIAKNVLRNVGVILASFVRPKVWVIAMTVLLFTASPRATAFGLASNWFLIAPTVVVLLAYALTLAQYRYIVPWELMTWIAFLIGLRFSVRRTSLPIYRWLAVLVAFVMLTASANGLYAQYVKGRADDARPEYQTAEGLQGMGLQRGDKVGIIGFDNDALWPYLAGFSVVAEINSQDVCAFWNAPQPVQAEVLQRFRGAGARVVVANNGGWIKNTSGPTSTDYLTCGKPWTGWSQIEGSPNHVYFLKNDESSR